MPVSLPTIGITGPQAAALGKDGLCAKRFESWSGPRDVYDVGDRVHLIASDGSITLAVVVAKQREPAGNETLIFKRL